MEIGISIGAIKGLVSALGFGLARVTTAEGDYSGPFFHEKHVFLATRRWHIRTHYIEPDMPSPGCLLVVKCSNQGYG